MSENYHYHQSGVEIALRAKVESSVMMTGTINKSLQIGISVIKEYRKKVTGVFDTAIQSINQTEDTHWTTTALLDAKERLERYKEPTRNIEPIEEAAFLVADGELDEAVNILEDNRYRIEEEYFKMEDGFRDAHREVVLRMEDDKTDLEEYHGFELYDGEIEYEQIMNGHPIKLAKTYQSSSRDEVDTKFPILDVNGHPVCTCGRKKEKGASPVDVHELLMIYERAKSNNDMFSELLGDRGDDPLGGKSPF